MISERQRQRMPMGDRSCSARFINRGKIKMKAERNTTMGCLCNIFDNEEFFWIIVIILLLLILNCSCCG